MQTVREQLAEAVIELLAHPTLGHYAINNMPEADYHDFMARYEGVKTALDRHRAEPEGCICDTCLVCAVSVRDCQCYHEGTEAQRERVGGGTA